MIGIKKFVRSSKIAKIMNNMSVHNGHHIYHIPASPPKQSQSHSLEVKHKCDGVILQPDRRYIGGTDMGLFKWKFQDHVTVDMTVRFHDGEASFSCNHNCDAGDVEVAVSRATVSLDEFDTARLAADVHAHLRSSGGAGKGSNSNSRGGGVAVAEIGLDPTSGAWFYHTLRRDKTRPNALATVLSTLTGLAENITAEELQYRLQAVPNGSGGGGSGSDDRWDAERHAQARHLLALQEKEQKSKRPK